MGIVLLSLLLQGAEIEVKQKAPEVRLAVTADGGGFGALVVRKRNAGISQGVMIETWTDETSSLAGAQNNRLRAEVKLARPGTYELSLGAGSARVAISRANLGGWSEEVDSLRDTVRKLQQIAAQIDSNKSPSRQQVVAWRGVLMAERVKIIRLKSEFTATHQAIMDGIDRLYFHYSLLKVPDVPEDGPVPEGYEPPVRKTANDATFPAVDEVKNLKEVLRREATLKLADEARLLLDTSDKEIRVVRWARMADAWRSLRDAGALSEAPEELLEIVKEAEKGADPAALLPRLAGLRSTLVK